MENIPADIDERDSLNHQLRTASNYSDIESNHNLPSGLTLTQANMTSSTVIRNVNISLAMKSPTTILAKDKRLDMLTNDLRKSIERLDKVIQANKSNSNVNSQSTLSKKGTISNKQSILSQKIEFSGDGLLATTGANQEINFNTDDSIPASQSNALARKTPLKSIQTLKKHSFVASTYSKQDGAKKSSSISTNNKGIRNNKSINTGITKTVNKLPQPTQPPQIITHPDDMSDQISSKSQPLRGLGFTVTSSAAIIEGRRNFRRQEITTNYTGRKSEAVLPSQNAIRKSSVNSQGSNNSGRGRIASINQTKSKSKLTPITLTSKNNNYKVESPKKQSGNAHLNKKEVIGAPYSLNFQRSKSARPQRKSLIQKKQNTASEYQPISNFDTHSRASIITGYSNPFLNTHGNQPSSLLGAKKSMGQSASNGHIRKKSSNQQSQQQFEFSPLKRAEVRLDQAIEQFDFDIFQDIHNEQENFRVFQRFCLLLLIIHGELERVQQDKSDEFLKQLNVFSEVVNIKQTINNANFQPSEITALYIDDEFTKNNKLQQFINVVVTFSVLKLKNLNDFESEKNQSQRFQSSNIGLNKKSIYDYTSDSQSTYSRFSQGTNRTTATALPVRSTSNNIKIGSPIKRKLSDTIINKSPEKITTKPLSPKKLPKPADIYGSMHVRKSSGKPKKTSTVKKTTAASKKKEATQMKFIQKIEDQYKGANPIIVNTMKDDKIYDEMIHTPKTHHFSAFQNYKHEVRSFTAIKKMPHSGEQGPDQQHQVHEYSFNLKHDETEEQKKQSQLLETPVIHQSHFIEEQKYSPEKKEMLGLVEEAFFLIKDNLDDFEKRGNYIFKMVECNHQQANNNFVSPIKQQKHIDLYDLMDVELRMIRQKNIENMDFQQQNQSAPAKDAYQDEDDYPNQRSKAFSHIESVMKDNINALSNSQIPPLDSDRSIVNSSGKKVINMDIIDKIKNMRSKSRDINGGTFNQPTTISQSAYQL